jgi:hypothetical protein
MMYAPIFAKMVGKIKALFHKAPPLREAPKSQVYQIEESAAEREPDRMRPTKAYFDQRQKARRNRRQKPSKAMRNLYGLKV